MEKLNIRPFFMVLMVICCITGCTKDLDLSPKDTLSDASFWKTPADFQKAANALYAALPGFSRWDTDADIVYNDPNSVSNSTLTTPDTDSNWNDAYTRIRNCNNLLEHAAASSIAADVKVYVAEAKFFRAYNYWSLYRLFGGVPIVTKVLDINSSELYGTRNSARETVDFILQELQEAAPDLPEEDQVAAADKGRITRGAAIALRARIALYEGTWRKSRGDAAANDYLDIAIEAAGTVINSGKYALFSAYGEESYRLLFIDEGDNAPECILDRRYERLVSPHAFPTDIGWGWGPTKLLADTYLCTDGLPVNQSPLFEGYETLTSEFQNRDPRMTQTIVIPGTMYWMVQSPEPIAYWPFYISQNNKTGYAVIKYMPQNPDYLMPPNHAQQTFDHHIIRYAEVLLIYAEAVYERNGNISDEDLNRTVNLLRQRAGLPVPLTNAFTTANSLDMRTEIRRERTVELALEGFRWDDLRRWKTAETELTKAIRGIKIVGTEWTEPIIVGAENRNPYGTPDFQTRADAEGFIVCEPASARSAFNPEKHYLRPIPAKEIQLNPNLQQNPNW